MTPIKFDAANRNYGKPLDWNEQEYGHCMSMPVLADGSYLYSYWEPTFWESLRLLFGGVVRLTILASQHPPVELRIEKRPPAQDR